MPPLSGRYAPQHLSNPFNHFSQHSIHQSNHVTQHPTQHMNYPTHGGGGNPSNVNIFGPGAGNAGLQGGGFQGGAANIGGGGGTGLGSVGAQAAFHHASALQQQQAQEAAGMGVGAKGMEGRIRQVWKTNLEQEMATLRRIVDDYPYISMVRDISYLDQREIRRLNQLLTGHRIPRHRRATDGRLHIQGKLSLPDAAV